MPYVYPAWNVQLVFLKMDMLSLTAAIVSWKTFQSVCLRRFKVINCLFLVKIQLLRRNPLIKTSISTNQFHFQSVCFSCLILGNVVFHMVISCQLRYPFQPKPRFPLIGKEISVPASYFVATKLLARPCD